MQQHSGGNVARASALLLQMLAAQERHEQQLAKIVSRLENEPSLKSEQQMNRLEADEISALRTELVVPPARATSDRDKAAEVADDET
jgi:redox-regulated HSP33 family molecular chaperone